MPAKKSTKTKKTMPKKASAKKVSTKKVSTKKVSTKTTKNQQKHQNLLQRKKYRLKLKLHWQIISRKLHLTSSEKMKNI